MHVTLIFTVELSKSQGLRKHSLLSILSVSVMKTPALRTAVFATDETKLSVSPSAKQRRNPCSRPPPVYQALSTRYDWPVKNAFVDLPIKVKGKSKCTSHFR